VSPQATTLEVEEDGPRPAVVQQPADQAGQHITQLVTLADVLAQLKTLVRLQQMANDRHEADARPVPLWKSEDVRLQFLVSFAASALQSFF
jgi:hypothetical protein